MIILTIILMLSSLYFLVYGGAFYDTRKEIAQSVVDKHDGSTISDDDNIKIGIKAVWMVLVALVMLALNLLMFTMAFSIDALRIPTLIMVVLTIVIPTITAIFKGKLNKDTEETRYAKAVLELQSMKRYTIKGVFSGLLRIAYLSLVLWVILGGNL